MSKFTVDISNLQTELIHNIIKIMKIFIKLFFAFWLSSLILRAEAWTTITSNYNVGVILSALTGFGWVFVILPDLYKEDEREEN